MTTLPPLPLMVLWLAWVIQAALCALQVQNLRRRLGKPIRPRFQDYRPAATVIVPFKGLDDHLDETLDRLFEQDYPEYRLVLVVDSKDDPAYPRLEQARARHPQRRCDLLVAGPAGDEEGQKVHNQLAAIRFLMPQAGDEEVWVFADSDAVPGPDWLGLLVGPVRRKSKTALSTGYRWLVPQEIGGSFWSRLASVCNSSAACQLGRYQFNHAWGGSMALKVATARRGNLDGLLRGALTDDYQFTRLARQLKLRVAFVPQCLVPTPVRLDRAGFFNFAHRQYLITRVYAPGLFALSLLFLNFYLAGLLSAWAYLVYSLALGKSSWLWPAGALWLVFLFNQVRAALRNALVRQAFSDEVVKRLRSTLRLDRWATSLWMGLHALVVLRALVGRTMTWRGIRYRLLGPQRVRRLD